jgi:hypothetical protein
MLLKSPPSSDDGTAGPTILAKKGRNSDTNSVLFCPFSN